MCIRDRYLAKGSKGISGFKKGRIKNGENLASIVREYKNYYGSIRGSMDSILNMEDEIRVCFRNLKEIYPDAVFPPVYFVIGALNSGGTTSGDGIVIGSEMYGLSDKADLSEVNKNNWLQSVLKPVRDIPHLSLIHIFQPFEYCLHCSNGSSSACSYLELFNNTYAIRFTVQDGHGKQY